MVLASCVCCPLNFICSACTDQRSRLKNGLFTGTGISRSMAETCNLRGEVLRLVKTDPEAALERFEGLMERSITRAKKLRLLPALNRNYNFATAVIGDSEAALNSAMILAESGLDVFLFGSSTNSFSEDLAYPNVHSFKNATVKSISGTLGEFQLSVETVGYEQKIQVGTVILGEKSRSRIPYIHQEELPNRTVASTLQKSGITGIPFFAPGATSIKGLYLADRAGVNMSKRNKGGRRRYYCRRPDAPGPQAKQGVYREHQRRIMPGLRALHRCLPLSGHHLASKPYRRMVCFGGRGAVQRLRQLYFKLSFQCRGQPVS